MIVPLLRGCGAPAANGISAIGKEVRDCADDIAQTRFVWRNLQEVRQSRECVADDIRFGEGSVVTVLVVIDKRTILDDGLTTLAEEVVVPEVPCSA